MTIDLDELERIGAILERGAPEDDPITGKEFWDAANRLKELLPTMIDEIRRLREVPRGDVQSQARAWSDVYNLLLELGMWRFNPPHLPATGRGQVLAFIRHLAEQAKVNSDVGDR